MDLEAEQPLVTIGFDVRVIESSVLDYAAYPVQIRTKALLSIAVVLQRLKVQRLISFFVAHRSV